MGRFGAFGGAWMSWFRQSGGGVNTETSSQIRPALILPMGLQVGPVIFEYTISWFPWIRSGNAAGRVGDAVYFSWLGGTVGIDLPLLPIEPYVGGEAGNYLFTSGAGNQFEGPVLKGGVNVYLGNKARIVLKAEYRRAFFLGDRGGWLPDGFSTSSDIIFAGLGFQFGFGKDGSAPSK